ncbi:MAG: hypothetical protein ACRD50_17480 [Candidatus Acidiferrales bacterium]
MHPFAPGSGVQPRASSRFLPRAKKFPTPHFPRHFVGVNYGVGNMVRNPWLHTRAGGKRIEVKYLNENLIVFIYHLDLIYCYKFYMEVHLKVTEVSISEAAKLAGVSRTHFYRKYINDGIVSVSRNKIGKPVIELSELFRVFGALHKDDPNITNGDKEKYQLSNITEAILQEKIKGLEALLKAREEELESYKEREKMLYRFLENKTQKRWWLFRR